MPDETRPPDLWKRMARLDECCHFSMISVQIADPGGGAHREWEVTIRHKQTGEIIYAKDRAARTAITQALDVAEEKGWPDGS